MKSILGLFISMAALAGCAPLSQSTQPNEPQLTPWHSITANAPTADFIPAEPPATPIPAPTPAPTIHIVALGETISSIALRYGLDMNAVLAANPEIDPYELIVGNQILIPLGDLQTQIGITTEPIALKLDKPECTHTPVGGLWCFSILSNPLGEAAANLAVNFKLLNSASEEIDNKTVPAILNKLDPGDSLPAVSYFPAPLPDDVKVSSQSYFRYSSKPIRKHLLFS